MVGLFNILLISSFYILLQGCSSAKKVPYFQNVPDSTQSTYTVPEHAYVEPVIQVNDLLFVSVQTIDNKAGLGDASTASAATNEKTNSYIVDKNGMIEVPLVGRVNLLGQTTTQAKETIRERASKYYVDPIINVRFMNFYINIIRDVARPGKYNITDEKTSIIDAVALAGDLSITGKRYNIMLIREENGQKRFIRFDMNSTDIFKSPYYYMRSGDIVYVEPLKARARAGTTDVSNDRYLSIVTSILSIGVLLFTVFNSSK